MNKELRIGNLVDLGNRIAKINEIYHTACTVLDLEETQDTIEDYERIKPIELTEEWLLKFGFEEKMFGWWSNVLFLRTDNRDGFFYDWQKTNETTGTYIEYVHQLQNLYFALVGEELTFKPE